MLRRSLVLSALALIAACSQQAPAPEAAAPPAEAAKPTIVLVHGAFMQGDAWDDVKAGLEAKGRKVVVVNLPGRPANPAPAGAQTLDAYRDTILTAVNAEAEPVVLVGHSFGGVNISNAAEAAPEKIKTLVYVAAYLPMNGQSLQALSGGDKGSKAGPAFRIDEKAVTAAIAAEQQAALFCNDCTDEQKAATPSKMHPEPLPPLAQPVTLTEKFAGVDKVYVRTAQDQVVSPALQDTMISTTAVRKVVSLDAGHSPFFTKTDELVTALDEAAS